MKILAIGFTALLFTAPVQASVYATQNKDGTWIVRKYNDDNPKIQVTYRDLKKTIKVKEFKEVEIKDRYRWKWTEEGKAKRNAYKQADEAWMEAGARVGATIQDGVTRRLPNKVVWCGSFGCNYPEPGDWDRPPKPSYRLGVDYFYGTKRQQVEVEKPNPNYLKLEKPMIRFSERATRPGGLPLVGSTERMSRTEFGKYSRWLGFYY